MKYRLLKDLNERKAGEIYYPERNDPNYYNRDGGSFYNRIHKEFIERNHLLFEPVIDMRDIWADQMWDGIIKMNEAYRDCLQKQIEEDKRKDNKNELTRKTNWPSEDKLMKTWQKQGIMFSKKVEEKEPIVISLIPGRKYLIGLADHNYDFLTVMTRKPLEVEEIEKRIYNIKKV
jgi:hypothetical protein